MYSLKKKRFPEMLYSKHQDRVLIKRVHKGMCVPTDRVLLMIFTGHHVHAGNEEAGEGLICPAKNTSSPNSVFHKAIIVT